MDEAQANKVRKRRVFYIPGYDPFHPRRYRELYRTESKAQAEISGYEIGLKPKVDEGSYGWQVAAKMDGDIVQADIDVLVWSDIVRESMASNIPSTYAQLIRTAWIYLSTGTLPRLMRMRKGPVIAALYPVAVLLAQLGIALLAFSLLKGGIESLGAGLVNLIGGWTWLAYPFAILGWGAGIAAFIYILRAFKAMDGKLFAYYLMHDFAYSARLRGAYPPELEDRLASFGDSIADALASDVDEVLVVGHSSGAHLAVTILADLIRAGRVPAKGPALGFLSLGQVVLMVSFLPDAHRLRADLRYLSMRDELAWIDVTAPGDGCSFALCDPVAVTGVAPDNKKWPLVISAAFTLTLSENRWNALRWRFFRLHFQYLCAFDQVRDYDYFRITAGPLTLRERFDGRAPSQSRIDVPVSKYTSVAA